jgi:alpha 1,3-glucosidase
MFPEDPLGFAIDDQYYVGDSGLLVKPITAEGVQEAVVYLSDNQVCHRPWISVKDDN